MRRMILGRFSNPRTSKQKLAKRNKPSMCRHKDSSLQVLEDRLTATWLSDRVLGDILITLPVSGDSA